LFLEFEQDFLGESGLSAGQRAVNDEVNFVLGVPGLSGQIDSLVGAQQVSKSDLAAS
jgi:hypothetical protein